MEVIDSDFIDRLAERIAANVGEVIPVERQLWDLRQVAKYLRRNTLVVRRTMACLPSFPKAIRLPSEGTAHPLYNAGEVMEWAQKYRDRN